MKARVYDTLAPGPLVLTDAGTKLSKSASEQGFLTFNAEKSLSYVRTHAGEDFVTPRHSKLAMKKSANSGFFRS